MHEFRIDRVALVVGVGEFALVFGLGIMMTIRISVMGRVLGLEVVDGIVHFNLNKSVSEI